MENLEQILEALRTLERRAWPLRIDPPHKLQQGVLYPGTPEKQYMPILQNFNWADEAILRGFVEGEIERRGLWKRYLEAITTRSAPSQNGKGVLWWRDTEHRPTLLEVLKAAVEVADR